MRKKRNQTKGFEDTCYKCGKVGHRRSEFMSINKKGGKQGNKFRGNCNLCGNFGHKKVYCWEEDSSTKRRPTKLEKHAQ